jgi:hypothetical protein
VADNVRPADNPLMATNEISGVHYDRVKIGRGVPGAFRDSSDSYTTGTINAANANLSTGTPTTNSTVGLAVPDAHATWSATLNGTWSPATKLRFQISPDNISWTAVSGKISGADTTDEAALKVYSDPVGGLAPLPVTFVGPINGGRFFRVTCETYNGTDSITVQIVTTEAPSSVFQNSPLPAGSSLIGQVAPSDGLRTSYSGAMNPTNTPGIANALDQWVLQNPAGSGKILRLTRLMANVALATAAIGTVSLVKRSTLNTGGTVVAGGKVAHDSTNPASAVATQGAYSAAPTASGTLAGIVRQERLSIPAVTAAPARIEWTFDRPAQAEVLRPGEQFSLTVGTLANAAAATAPTVSGDVEWTEEV